VERLGRQAVGVGLAADLVERQQAREAVEGRVLERLGHHRAESCWRPVIQPSRASFAPGSPSTSARRRPSAAGGLAAAASRAPRGADGPVQHRAVGVPSGSPARR
jgi:hypothetical protein